MSDDDVDKSREDINRNISNGDGGKAEDGRDITRDADNGDNDKILL